jgi:hypothetical protein
MKSKRMLVLALALVAALLTGGWAAPQAGLPETADDQFLAVQRQVPGFGGMFLDGETLKVYLTETHQRPMAERAIAAILGADAIPAGGVQILQARYDFGRLKAWQNRATELFDIPGVVFTDVDEAINRLTIGVEYPVAQVAVQNNLERLGIDLEAVQIVETAPIVQLLSLRERVRPLQGGVQINFPGYLCTYGFNATRAGVPGFVTNSHCTSKQGGVEGTQYWQPTQAIDSTVIGVETVDPTYSSSKCPSSIKGKVCRYSDSAFVKLNITDYQLGRIARTNSVNSGSLTISGYHTISNTGTAAVGATVSKTGRTTGWTQGKVTRTCTHTGVSGSNIVQLCQTHVSAGVDSGDSGSPVFSGSGNVTLLGILWGGGSGTFVYSPLANIQRADELGTLTVR